MFDDNLVTIQYGHEDIAMESSAAQFKGKCLRLMDEIARTREPIVITKRGRAVAKLVPVEPDRQKRLFGCMAGTVVSEGDIMAPLDVEWEATAEPTSPAPAPRKSKVRRG